MTKQIFRRLIVLAWLCSTVALVTDLATSKYLPPELRNYLEAQKNKEPTDGDWILLMLGVSIIVASVIVSIGLYRFRPWAKKLLLPVNFVALVLVPFYGPSVMTGWASALYYVCALVGGGILFLVYLPPISQMFETHSDAQQQALEVDRN